MKPYAYELTGLNGYKYLQEAQDEWEPSEQDYASIVPLYLAPPDTGWQPMGTAPTDGKHVILAVQSGAFVWSVQGAFDGRQWNSAIGANVQPLAWMRNILLPDEFKPWTKSDTNHACTPLQEQYE